MRVLHLGRWPSYGRGSSSVRLLPPPFPAPANEANPGFWMSDKPLVQQALANDIALLTLAVRPKKGPERPLGRVARFRSAMCYLRGFWEAVVREWEGLDRLRCVPPSLSSSPTAPSSLYVSTSDS